MIALTWLGHAAFRFDLPTGERIYVDPFLTGNPSCPAHELTPDRVDAILVTHGHDDHVGDAVALARAFACPVIAQVELRGLLGAEIGDDMTQAINKGGGRDLLGSRVTLTHANHSSSNGGSYTGESCGFVIETPGEPTLYVAGDTNVFGGHGADPPHLRARRGDPPDRRSLHDGATRGSRGRRARGSGSRRGRATTGRSRC